MTAYATQMDAARKGITTPQMEIVAAKEGIDVARLRALVAKGEAVIPANVHHASLDPHGIGFALRTKINVNLGTSRDWSDLDMEMGKVADAVRMGAESIMDLSTYGDTRAFRRRLTAECPAIIGTVPIYDAVVHYGKALRDITSAEWLDVLRMHAEDGVDFVTLHCGMNRAVAQRVRDNRRLMNVVSRGGSLMFAWMMMTGEENPYYEHFDEVLDICRTHDVTISLGDSCRPGCLADAGDAAQVDELVTLGELTLRAWERDVQVIIEGPGHVPLDQVVAQMKLEQTVCHGAPFYVLGPLVTDVAPGYDHITAAIGGALAASSGASFLCYVTPAEPAPAEPARPYAPSTSSIGRSSSTSTSVPSANSPVPAGMAHMPSVRARVTGAPQSLGSWLATRAPSSARASLTRTNRSILGFCPMVNPSRALTDGRRWVRMPRAYATMSRTSQFIASQAAMQGPGTFTTGLFLMTAMPTGRPGTERMPWLNHEARSLMRTELKSSSPRDDPPLMSTMSQAASASSSVRSSAARSSRTMG